MSRSREENREVLIKSAEKNGNVSYKDWFNQPWYVKLVFAIMVIFMIYSGMIIYAKSMEYVPFTVYHYDIEPDVACGGDAVEVYYDGELVDYILVDAIYVEGQTFWVSADDDRPYGGNYFRYDIAPFERQTFKSPTRRQAPFTEGEWRAGVDATLHSRAFGVIDVTQHIQSVSDDTLNVEGRRSEGCG
jgi:hypothetical protein